MKNNGWFVAKEDGKEFEIDIYDMIGADGIDAKSFIASVKGAVDKCDSISMRINSPGGSVFDGLAIYNYLNSLDKPISCRIEGLCASMASIVMCAADRIVVPQNSFIMIHNPVYGLVQGGSEDMRDVANMLDKMGAMMARIYAKKSGLPEADCFKMMEDETWMDGQEACNKGFADELADPVEMAAKFDLSAFAHAPDKLKEAMAITQTEFIPQDMLDLLNRQIGREIYAANFYKQAGGIAHNLGLNGFHDYFEDQSGEEFTHSTYILRHVIEGGGMVSIPAVEKPNGITDGSTIIDLVNAALELEKEVTKDWTAISELSKTQPNSATLSFAQWFMCMQQESESAAMTLCQQVKLADSGTGVLLIDSELKAKLEGEGTMSTKDPASAEAVAAAKAAEENARAEISKNAEEKVKTEFKAMVDLFGEDKAAKYFAKGITLDQAKDAYIADMRAENGTLKKDKAEIQAQLDHAVKHPGIPFDPQAAASGTAKMRVSEEFLAKYCKDHNIKDEKFIAQMRKELSLPVENKKEENE